MVTIQNYVAHFYEGKHDKIYAACIRKNTDGTYSVVGKWGRRGRNVAEMTKGKYATLYEACSAAENLFNEKLNKGYEDITSANYIGPLTFDSSDVAQYLEATPLTVLTPTPEPMSKPDVDPDEEFVVKCLTNVGYKKQFDVGVEYVARYNPEDERFYIVYDKCGQERVVFADRFDRCED